MAGARFRARWAKQIVAACKRAPAPIATRLTAAIPESARLAIRRTGLLDWVDEAPFLALCGAIHETLDVSEREALWTGALRVALDAPLLAPLLAGGLGIFGRTPSAILRMTPQAWTLLTRDAGRAVHDRAGAEGRLSFVDMPAHLVADAAFVDMLRGYTAATLAWTGHHGTVTAAAEETSLYFDVRVD
jgi:hypothetical protein